MLRKSHVGLVRPEAPQPVGNPDDGDSTSQFLVLYYKRKNKVHKAKGVSKMDGVLKLNANGNMVSLTTPTGEPVVAPRRDADISLDLNESDVLTVGAYEVEIVARVGGSSSSTSPCNGPLHGSTRSLLTKKDLGASMKPLVPRKSLLSRQVGPVSTESTSNSAISRTGFAKKEAPKRHFLLPPKQRLPLAEKPLVASGPRSFVKRPLVPLLNRTSTSNQSTAATAVSFPGAVGTIDVPHSIRTALKPHQRTGLVFLWNCLHLRPEDQPYRGGAILADEMGLGKTLMTIATICALYRQQRNKKYIVVCPSSLVSNWAKEFDKWLGTASQPKRLVVKKGGDQGLHQIKVFGQDNNSHHSVLILSYELFRLHIEHFQGISCRLLVVDEGHRLKNTAGSLTLTALESLDCESRLLLTATPIQNVLSDFYTISNFCNPGILGELSDFRRDFERPIAAANLKNCNAAVQQKGAERARQLEHITKTFMLRRLQKDVLRAMLPPRSEVLLFCRPSVLQAAQYRDMTASAHGEDALTTLTSLRRLCLHPSLASAQSNRITSHDDVSVAQSGKLAVLDNLLTQIRSAAPEDKVVIVSNFTSALGLIQDAILKPRNLSFVRLDGSTELSSRQTLVDTFNATSSERTFCFLLSSKAGGCGLNLIGANRLIMVDPDWNPASDIQAMARVYRQGQEKTCTIYRLFTSGTVEEVICQRQMQKGNLASQAVDSKKGGLGFSKEELKDCFTLKHVACDTKTKLGNLWPNYEGPESIVAQGCNDTPLLLVASSSPELVFVHVVDDSEGPLVVVDEDAKNGDADDTDDSMTSEEEWPNDEDNDLNHALPSAGAGSSDEEYEFE